MSIKIKEFDDIQKLLKRLGFQRKLKKVYEQEKVYEHKSKFGYFIRVSLIKMWMIF